MPEVMFMVIMDIFPSALNQGLTILQGAVHLLHLTLTNLLGGMHWLVETLHCLTVG